MKAPNTTTQRLEAFSDAVIAIAITLLVIILLELPHVEHGLFDALVDHWPSFVAFIISFVVIGIMWVSHHAMFERIATVDRPLLFLNLLLLMGIAFLPFPTDLLATYVADGGGDAHVAAAMYSTTMTLIGIVFLSMWVWLARNPSLVVEGIPPERVRKAMIRSLVSPVVYGLTIGLAFISAVACMVVYGAIAIYFARGPSARAAAPEHARSDAE